MGKRTLPFIFFFETARISLTWTDFRRHVQFSPNYRPPGVFLRVVDAERKLRGFDGLEAYLQFLRDGREFTYGGGTASGSAVAEASPEVEYLEGQRLVRERSFFKRNPELVREAKDHYGYKCQVCGFDFAECYGPIGERYIECHHLNPLSERDEAETVLVTTIADLAVLCSNCHRMIHRTRPAMHLEVLKSMLR